MAEKDNFKVTNPKAPFIRLTKMLSVTSVPKHKHGDVNWLSKNISHFVTDPSELKEFNKLLDNLTFKKKGKK